MRQNFIAQFIPRLKPWLWDMWSDTVMQKNWVLSVDQWRLQALQFLEHLIDLLSILLRCSGFARIQEAVVDQTSSTPAYSDRDLFLVQIWLWEVLWSFFSVQPLRWGLPFILQHPLFIAYHSLIEKWFIVVVYNKGR